MLKIKQDKLDYIISKYDFHKGYNQHNENANLYDASKNDTLRINHITNEIFCGDNLWICWEDYYTWGGIEKFYDLTKADLVEKVDEV